MSASRRRAGAAVVTAAVTAGVLFAPPAAAGEGWGINGTFATSSNGDFAKVNERFQDQPGERSTWTINTECVSPTECTGTVTSDAGWSAPIYTTNGLYYVKRVVPNWRFCADGQPVEGLQVYKIYPVGFDGHVDASADEYTGENQTTGPSGSCGRNQWPSIRMPFYMKKI
ncbi:MAG: hypothetical protein HZB45_26390 [Mycolicibacterium rufum]|uniref:Secreted protein n=1 Tax=Mycolicibacterium chlorophenolicum TaxID=37916 RepID=A0A0J6VGN5_9MYCO|nr:hypothetical protein [Mycolicibacterium chlorophenolicum]KMO68628.1 hypothetical protein MCHLDSM_06161 [Mycolicibacterium chlorophenolicum]MBI5341229.1 hypothetical protein [Mycolicibacterium rufum]